MTVQSALETATSPCQAASDLLPARIPILVVDDDPSVLQVTRLVLSRFQYKNRPLDIIEASSAAEAKLKLHERPDIAIVLLDVVMESDDAGLRLVEYIRHAMGNQLVRILLRTGQPGFAPERQVVQDYDINDYLLKSEVTQSRLLLSLTTAIRGYSDIKLASHLASRVDDAEQQSLMAKRASVAKTQFLAHMSHEIRTPLNGIHGIVELLNDTPLNAEQQTLMRDLRYASEALLGVVNDVLDVAKIEAGKLEINIIDFAVKPLLEKICAVFASSMQHKGIQFQHEFLNIPEHLKGDPQRIQQIIINYLSNAFKFTPSGGAVTLRVKCCNEADKIKFYAEVEDNGKGIRIDRLNDIFNAYEQESSQTALLFGGTGLGLSLSRTLADMMGGEVGVESELGKGSKFWVSIPLAMSTKTPQAENQAPAEAFHLSVAVCEDDTLSRQVMQRFLKKSGINVVAFENGQLLLDANIVEQMDVLILDYHMPVLDGLQTARALRAAGCSKPILALTAAVTAAERDECLQAGMDDVLSKPVEWPALLNWLRRYNKP